jgi:hypothetical protein
MGERRCTPCLAPEALDQPIVARTSTAENLEGYIPVQNLIMCQINIGHPTTAQRPIGVVACIQDLAHGVIVAARQLFCLLLLVIEPVVTCLFTETPPASLRSNHHNLWGCKIMDPQLIVWSM